MTIRESYEELIPGLSKLTHLSISYDSGAISQTDIYSSNAQMVFTFVGGEQLEVDVSDYLPLDIVYLAQFGLSLTDNGEYFFLQSWERGLFCFATRSGELLWHRKEKRASEVVVHRESVVCRYDHRICKISISTGELLSAYPISAEADFVSISDTWILTGPKRNKYLILDENLREIAKIPQKLLNPKAYDHFIIQDAEWTRDGLRITGVEYSTAMLMQFRQSNQSGYTDELGKFERVISLTD